MNTADYFMDIASIDLASSIERGENVRLRCLQAAKDYLQKHPEGFMNSLDNSQALSSVPDVRHS